MHRILVVVLLVAAFAGCKSWRQIYIDRDELKLHATNAQHAYHAGKYEMAVQQAQKALSIDEDDAKARTLLGYCYLQVARYGKTRETRLEYYEKSEAAFEEAIRDGSEKDPAIFKAYFGLGLVCFMWAKEVEAMMETATGKETGIDAVRPGGAEDLWGE
jgi:tetratricopeptide (TPR) repeat protein